MVKSAKNFLQLLLKIVNATIGIVGIAMVMYSIWMVRVWQRDLEDSSYDDYDYSLPWFIHVFLGIGIILCAISCLGHVAANTANSCCLSFYMITIFVLLLVETGLIADIFLNSDWVKDLPNDPSGRFDDFKDFVKSNFDICKWIGLLIILAQGCSVLLATVLRTLRTDLSRSYNYMYNSDDEEYLAPRLTLLDHTLHPLYYATGDLPFSSENNTIKHKSRESNHESSRTKEWSRIRDSRDYKDRNERDSGGRHRNSYGRPREHNSGRHRDYDQDRDRRSRRRSRSRSNEKIRKRSKSRSPSPSKRRTSGFDMAPSVPGLLPGAAVPGNVGLHVPLLPMEVTPP